MTGEKKCIDEKLAEINITRDYIDMALESIDYEGEPVAEQPARQPSRRSCAIWALFMGFLSMIMVGLGIGRVRRGLSKTV